MGGQIVFQNQRGVIGVQGSGFSARLVEESLGGAAGSLPRVLTKDACSCFLVPEQDAGAGFMNPFVSTSVIRVPVRVD